MRMRTLFLAAAVATVAASGPAGAQAPAELFKGKTINLMIGFGPGGANDVWARAIAKHMPKHLPGNPNIVPQNVPGAGGLKLMNQLANVSPKDGTAIGLVNRGIPLEPLLGGQGTQFDPMKMNWIGSPDKDVTVCSARKDAAVQKMEDLFSKELIVGATGSGADTAIYPEFLAELLGMKFKTIKGYPGSKEISLAMERKEVQGICLAYDSLMRQPLARDGKVNILFQAALTADPRLKDVPIGTDLARSEADRAALKLFFARVALGRPFVAPPGVPAERVTALRNAFDETMKDPDFLADAKRQDLSVDAITGQEIADIIADVYKTPKDVVARTSEALGRISK
ncbi:MAG: Bug family tripartite tricarboxylate transporter substrate binding protein [Gemmatimonas sp.]